MAILITLGIIVAAGTSSPCGFTR